MNWDIAKVSEVITRHNTGVGLCDAFWQATKEIAWARESDLSGLGAERDMASCDKNLSLAFVWTAYEYFRMQSASRRPARHSNRPRAGLA
jgi:predicted DNA-binding ribbon-helix-helix protein